LAGQLCWYSSSRGRENTQQPLTAGFPSWSWASYNGLVSPHVKIDSCITAVSYTSPDRVDEENIVVDAKELTLRGLVVPIQLRHRPRGYYRTMDMITLKPLIYYDEPAGYYIRPSWLASITDEETTRITAIPEEDRTKEDILLLNYLVNGERNYQMDYTSTKAQPSEWQDRGYIALLVGEHVGSGHNLEGKYQWGIKFSHWMILAPVSSSGEPRDTQAATKDCQQAVTYRFEGQPQASYRVAGTEAIEQGDLKFDQLQQYAQVESEGIRYERVAMTMKSGILECRLRPEGEERVVTIV
jgi:hypothetical protein